ncbi:MAG: OsmC family protein [Akkermansiaceae bacterium]
MIEVTTNYLGQLRCRNTHQPSNAEFETDAPVDNNGRGESFSPTDLVATALASCMATIMGIVADRKGLDLTGMQITVSKHMSQDQPRRIAKLDVKIEMPLPEGHSDRKMLESSALSCPVHQSLHPDIEVPIKWCWQTSGN